jgi:hypothetical protein
MEVSGSLPRRWPFWLTLMSLLSLVWLPLTSKSPHGDLSSWYTDHLHHSFATWVFLQRGASLYSRPFSEVWSGTQWPYPTWHWGQMPLACPPGMLVLFLPLALLGRFGGLSLRGFGVAGVVYLLTVSHLAFYSVLRALESLPAGSRAVLALLVWALLVHLALQGFYDGVVIGCGAMMALRLRLDDAPSALRWLAVAALLHYRAIVLAPLGLFALLQVAGRAPARAWPWRTLLFVALAASVCIGSFLLMYPATAAFRAATPRVLGDAARAALAVGVSALAALIAAWTADRWVAAAVAVCLGLAAVEVQDYWWHGAVLLLPALLVGAARPPAQASVARAALLAWALLLAPLVWRDPLLQLFPDLVHRLTATAEPG